MSVIQYTSDEEVLTDEKKMESKPIPIPNKMRVAFIGQTKSGKTFAAKLFEKNYKRKYGVKHTIVQYISYKSSDEYIEPKLFRSYSSDTYINEIENIELTSSDLIIVDDLLYKDEAQYLRDKGYVIIYLKTPWHVRLKRLIEDEKSSIHVSKQTVRWLTHSSELALEKIPDIMWDYCICDEKQLEGVVNNLIGV